MKEQNDMGLYCKEFILEFPPQHQDRQPGFEYVMKPLPIFDNPNYKGSGRLKDKVAIITGGDSGLGRAIAVCFAKEDAKVVIAYYDEDQDAQNTANYIRSLGKVCYLMRGDIKQASFCQELVERTIQTLGKLDVLVNDAGVQYYQKNLLDISDAQFDETMKTNVYGMFYLTRAALKYMKGGSSIINLSSITTFKGEPELIDYVTTKGAIVGFTRSLATNLAKQNIRVNAVAPGFFWTPLQPACWPAEKIPYLAAESPMGRAGQPYEIAPLFVYLASDESSYVTGQVMHINGGEYKG